MIERLYLSWCKDKKKVEAIAKLKQKREELKLRYVRFYHEVDKIDRSSDHRFCDLGITIAFLFGISSAKYIRYKWSYLPLFIAS